jgi:hypothetical protein
MADDFPPGIPDKRATFAASQTVPVHLMTARRLREAVAGELPVVVVARPEPDRGRWWSTP